MVLGMEMTKTYQYRKVMKPMLERKRRARINKCLDDLKDLMVECLKQDGEHVTRLEKADILELTVDHMRKLKKRGILSRMSVSQLGDVECFRSGFVHAANQVSKALATTPGVDVDLGTKLMTFLGNRLHQICHNQPDLQPQFQQIPHSMMLSSGLECSPSVSPSWSETASEYHHHRPRKCEEFQPAICLDRKEVIDFSRSDLWRPW